MNCLQKNQTIALGGGDEPHFLCRMTADSIGNLQSVDECSFRLLIEQLMRVDNILIVVFFSYAHDGIVAS